MISASILYKFSKDLIGEFAVGTSILPIDDITHTKYSTEIGGRYNFWIRDTLPLSGFLKIHLSYYNNQISRPVGVAIGVGGVFSFIKLDVGLSSFVEFLNIQLGPY